ncbi:MAG TPA: AAA family ATPase [Pseudonocardia sp.]|nr:AAA family ATPase [Pseudonocardia sp.]
MDELLERGAELEQLGTAIAEAKSGRGSMVLIFGEAGIGKTSLVRAFVRGLHGVRLLAGACDDLLTPRTFGPLRDAARGCDPLAEALASGDREAVLAAVTAQLARPSVLVVEDVHWADDATIDVLRYVGRRIEDLPSLLLVTYRDDEIGPGHPLHRVLGLSGPQVCRLPLRPLSRAAVARWARGTAITSASLYALTSGNPFFVSEALASPSDGVPATVVDAVLARVGRLDGPVRDALEQLAVVPTQLELPLARALLGDLALLADGERSGVLEVRPQAVAFRHELARRAVEDALPTSRRMVLHERVLAVLLAQDAPDLSRVVHHAVRAGNDATVVAYAPEAARAACAAGAQTQGAALYREALDRADLLTLDQRAELAEARSWALFHANRRRESLAVAEEAVALRERLGDVARLGHALASLALQQWSNLAPDAALASARRAVELLEPSGDSVDLMFAQLYLAMVLTNVDQDEEALVAADSALAIGERLGAQALRPMANIYRARALWQLGDPAGPDMLRRATTDAAAAGAHEASSLGYLSTAALLWRSGRFAELDGALDAAAEYGRGRDFATFERACEAYRARLRAFRGQWDSAEAELRTLLADDANHGMLARHALPGVALLAVRRGADDAPALLAAARSNAVEARSLQALVPAAAAAVEHAWLTGDRAWADDARALLARLERPGRERYHGELLRWLRRCGEPVEPFEGCPEEFAAGLRGDWRAAASGWERIGAPYERALELVDSGEVDATLEALAVFDRLGADPAARLVRRRLRELGVRQIPRGPQPTTRVNPAGLTDRQVEILRLLSEGLTNAEIAERLVLSVRTVDHHVSAVLQKLGVGGRRDAAAALRRLDLAT